ncbi:outer membrane protein [Bradyrhizobium sp. SYSU BS000235]|uniref:outer membrane protein n=1 Tax=Bradyrhizobium sp. SYSU BS000235 TaxID=3411332 RepID=UPI003C730085
MKKFLVTAALLLASGGIAPALAADMAVKAPPPPPLPVMYNWSGFYIGANGGWGDSHNCLNFDAVVGTAFDDGCRNRSGGVVGGQIGYRWQSNQFVFGLEAQGDWADLSNTRISLLDPTLSTRVKTDGIGLFTGQLGWAWNAALLYVKGGAAVAGNKFEILDTASGIGLVSASNTRWGGTLGVGFEYGFAPNWSIGAEYNHLWMGDANNSFTVVDPRLIGFTGNRIDQDIDMVTLRINYRFGGYSPPIAARY